MKIACKIRDEYSNLSKNSKIGHKHFGQQDVTGPLAIQHGNWHLSHTVLKNLQFIDLLLFGNCWNSV